MAKRQKGLGRGLDALLGDTPQKRAGGGDEGGRKPLSLPIEHLHPNPNQPRRLFDDAAIGELAASIKARGLLQPILVRPIGEDKYEIVAGERRWRAAQKAQLHDVPVVIRTLDDTEAAEIALIENIQRVDLNPMEEALAYQRLADEYKRTQDDIAKAVGKSRSHVANMMRLLQLPDKCRRAVIDGAISFGHAKALLGAEKPDVMLGEVLKKGLSVRETERLVHIERADGEIAKSPPTGEVVTKPSVGGKKDADTRALENDLAAALGLEVEIEHSRKGAGAVTIRYLNLDQLDDVCRRLTGSKI